MLDFTARDLVQMDVTTVLLLALPAMLPNIIVGLAMESMLPFPFDWLGGILHPSFKSVLTMWLLGAFTNTFWMWIDHPVRYVVPTLLTIVLHCLLFIALASRNELAYRDEKKAEELTAWKLEKKGETRQVRLSQARAKAAAKRSSSSNNDI